MSCSSIVMLKTDKPEGRHYRFIYGHMLIDYDEADTKGRDSWDANIESQLNAVLRSGSVTRSCTVVKGSVSIGEPGSQGMAMVQCKKVIDFIKHGEVFDNNGSPIYIYKRG